MTELRQIAVVRSYDELIAAMRSRADAIKLTRVALDDAMKTLPDGYAGKLLSPIPVRTFGRVSLGPMLQVLGMAIVLIEDADALERVRKKVTARAKVTNTGRNVLAIKKRRRSRFPKGADHARLMRARQILKQTPEQRSRVARMAAKARWRKHREGQKKPINIDVLASSQVR